MQMIPDKLFINLRILSKIQKNGRVSKSINGVISLESNVFYQSIKRFLSQDSRQQTVHEIRSIVADAIECGTSIVNSRHLVSGWNVPIDHVEKEIRRGLVKDLVRLTEELKSAQLGISNLVFTYQEDPNTVSQLDICIMKITEATTIFNAKLINVADSREIAETKKAL